MWLSYNRNTYMAAPAPLQSSTNPTTHHDSGISSAWVCVGELQPQIFPIVVRLRQRSTFILNDVEEYIFPPVQ